LAYEEREERASSYDRSVVFLEDSLDLGGAGKLAFSSSAPPSSASASWAKQKQKQKQQTPFSSYPRSGGLKASRDASTSSTLGEGYPLTSPGAPKGGVGLAGMLGTKRVRELYKVVGWLQQMGLVDLDKVRLSHSASASGAGAVAGAGVGREPASPYPTTAENVQLLKLQAVLSSLDDGLLLCRIVSRVTNNTVTPPFPSPSNSAQRLSNLKVAISAVTAVGGSKGSTMGSGARKIPTAACDGIALEAVLEGDVDAALTLLLAIKRANTLLR
jgi:hypothetical protein